MRVRHPEWLLFHSRLNLMLYLAASKGGKIGMNLQCRALGLPLTRRRAGRRTHAPSWAPCGGSWTTRCTATRPRCPPASRCHGGSLNPLQSAMTMLAIYYSSPRAAACRLRAASASAACLPPAVAIAAIRFPSPRPRRPPAACSPGEFDRAR